MVIQPPMKYIQKLIKTQNNHKTPYIMSKPFKVAKPYRTNPLSHTEGGDTVRVIYHTNEARDYVNIKNTSAYIMKALAREDVKEAFVLLPGMV